MAVTVCLFYFLISKNVTCPYPYGFCNPVWIHRKKINGGGGGGDDDDDDDDDCWQLTTKYDNFLKSWK